MSKYEIRALVVVIGLALGNSAMAHFMSIDEYSFYYDSLGVEFNASRVSCDSLAANAKDACVVDAHARQQVAQAELEVGDSRAGDRRYQAFVVAANADYLESRKKCDNKAGNAQDDCVKNAKALLATAVDIAKNPAKTTLGMEIDDSVVTTKVKSELIADHLVKSFDIKVVTRKNEVQLSGFVDNQAQADRAIAITRAVEGVMAVENHMTLKSGTMSLGGNMDDGIVTVRVKFALLSAQSINSFDVGVVTRKGWVQLSGYIDSRIQIDLAIELVRNVEGVQGVVNEMSIKK